MSAAAVIALALIITIAHDVVLALLSRRQKPNGPLLDELEAASVVIHTRDGKSIAGALLAARPDGFLLEHADSLTPDGRVSIGTVVVPRANVSFFQRLSAGDGQ